MNGLVSNAVWTGRKPQCRSSRARDRAYRPRSHLLGMDTEQEPKWEAGNAAYPSPHGWSIYVQDAQAPGNLLAFAMNGRPPRA